MSVLKYSLFFLSIILLHDSVGYCQCAYTKSVEREIDCINLVKDVWFIDQQVREKSGNSAFLFYDENLFDHKRDSIIKVLKARKVMRLNEFYLLIAPWLNKLNDDHLKISLFNREFVQYYKISKTSKIVIDNYCLFRNDSLFVICDSILSEGTFVISIGGIQGSHFIEQLMPFVDATTRRYYAENGKCIIDLYSLSLIINALFGFTDSVQVEAFDMENNREFKINLPLTELDYRKRFNCPKGIINKSWFELNFIDDVAILDIRSFKLPDKAEYVHMLDSIFKILHTRNTVKLLVDVSQNRGGNDLTWMILLTYLTSQPFKVNCNGEFVRQKDISFLSNTQYKPENIYSGELYLFCGIMTYSSAVRFCDVLISNDIIRASFGKPTLGSKSHYGQAKHHYLPESGLSFTVSQKFFPSIQCQSVFKGLKPGIIVKSSDRNQLTMRHDEVLNIIVDYISK